MLPAVRSAADEGEVHQRTVRALRPVPSVSASIEILSGVSVFTGEPYIQLRWGTEMGQLTPDEARQHALAILEVAEAAESDALIVKMLQEDVGVGEQEALQFLVRLRERRAE